MRTTLARFSGLDWAKAGFLLVLFYFYMSYNRGFAVDDSYITFRYVQNALAGHGLVFNVGQHYYGSTATGYAVLLLVLVKVLGWVRVLVDVHQVATLLSALSITSIAGLCGHMLLRGQRPSALRLAAAALVATFVAVLPASSVVSAHETYFYLALLLWASHLAIVRRRVFAAVGLLVFAHAVRPDSLLFALILLSALLVAAWLAPRQAPARVGTVLKAVLAFLAGALAWLCAMKLYYGTFFPGTMDAKKAQVLLGDWPLFELATVLPTMDGLFAGRYWWMLAVFPLAAAAWHLLAPGKDGVRRLKVTDWGLLSGVWFVFAVGLFSAYSVFDVTLWTWYVVPIALALVISAAAAAGGLAGTDAMDGSAPLQPDMPARRYWAGAGAAILAAAMLTAQPGTVALAKGYFTGRNVNTHLQSYDSIVRYLREHAPDGTSVALAEPGTFGFKLGPRYQVYDILGLASPGVAKALLAGDKDYVTRTWDPEYVVVSWSGSFNLDGRPGFAERYERVGEFGHAYWDATIQRGIYLYRRRPEASAP